MVLSSLTSQLRMFLIALQFLTRVPIGRLEAPKLEEIGRSLLYYPLVGLLLGGVFSFTMTMVSAHVPPIFVGALLLAVWVASTGGLHLDGLADSADAWACGGSAERRLAVMKDPNCGPAAVSTLIVTLILKFAALMVLVTNGNWLPIMLAPMLGRASPIAIFLTTPYVRPGGLGAAMAAHLPRGRAWLLLVVMALGTTLVGHLAMFAAAVVVLLLLRRLMIHNLDGATGDTIGATVELVETVVLGAATFVG
jgi:adenosylcobinamide-GDP ribazoletransferase